MFWWDWAALRKQLHRLTLQHHQSKNFTLLQKHTPLWLAESREGQRPTHINHFPAFCLTVLGPLKASWDMRDCENPAQILLQNSVFLNKVSQARAMSTSHSTNQLFLHRCHIWCVKLPGSVSGVRKKKKHPLDLLFLFLKKKKERRKRVMSTPKSPSV